MNLSRFAQLSAVIAWFSVDAFMAGYTVARYGWTWHGWTWHDAAFHGVCALLWGLVALVAVRKGWVRLGELTSSGTAR